LGLDAEGYALVMRRVPEGDYRVTEERLRELWGLVSAFG